MALAMSVLLPGHVAWIAALGLALIALAARLIRDHTRRARDRHAHPRGHLVMDERIKARLEATIWPD
jgi:hypothetical protein